MENIIQVAFDNLGKSTVSIIKNVQQGDHLTDILRVTFADGHPAIASVQLHARKSDGSVTPNTVLFVSESEDDVWSYALPSWFTEYEGDLVVSISVQFAPVVNGFEFETYTNLASFPLTGENEIAYVALDTKKVYLWLEGAYEEQTSLTYEIPRNFQRQFTLFIEPSVISSGDESLTQDQESNIISFLTSQGARISLLEEDMATAQADIIALEEGKSDVGHTHVASDIIDFDEAVNNIIDDGLTDLTLDSLTLNSTTNDEQAVITFDGERVKLNYLGIELEVGENSLFIVQARTTITEGQVIQYDGAVGASGKVYGKPAVASEIDAFPELVLGVATESGSTGDLVRVNWFGDVHMNFALTINGTPTSEGILYADVTDTTHNGRLTYDKPTAPHSVILVAVKTYSNPAKTYLSVRPTIRPKLADLSDVENEAVNNDVLVYNDGVWSPEGSLKLDEITGRSSLLNLRSPNAGSTISLADDHIDILATDVNIEGKLYVSGEVTTLDTQTVKIEDNIILINGNQTGTPSSLLKGGIEVERGDLTNYQFVFDESDDRFKVGQDGSLQTVATRQDDASMVSNGIPYWNASANRFDTSSTVVSSAPSTGNVPLTINALSGQTSALQRWQINSIDKAFILNNGYLYCSGTQNVSSGNNSTIDTSSTGTVISRNKSDVDDPAKNPTLIVNNANTGSTADIQRWQFGGVSKAKVDTYGNYYGAGVLSSLGPDYARITTLSSGTEINRNRDDSSPTLTVNNKQGTGNIQTWQFGGLTVMSVDRFGVLYTNAGIRSTDNNLRVGTVTTGLNVNKISGTGNIVTFQYNDINQAVLTYDGKLGIGTTSPDLSSGSGVVVYNSTAPRIELRNSTTGTTSTDGGGLAVVGNDLYLYNRENANLRIETNSSTRMLIDSSGNLGIATTSPTEKLEVSGNAKATKFIGAVNETNANASTYFWRGTQAQYDAIGTKDSNTLYIIV